MGCISIERNQDKQNNGNSVNDVGESGNESIINEKDNSHAKKTHYDPLGLFYIKGFLLETVEAVAGTVNIYETDEADRQNQEEKSPIKIEK